MDHEAFGTDVRVEGNSVTFFLRVRPRSSIEKLRPAASGEWRLDVHAPASEGEANEACIDFFARSLRIPKNSIAIISGSKSRRKLIRFSLPNAVEIAGRLKGLAAETKSRRTNAGKSKGPIS